MHISSYYKARGDSVTLETDYGNIGNYDLVMISKVFEDTLVPELFLRLPNVKYGGTGFFFDKAEPLPDEIEHTFPDYDLYSDWIVKMVGNGADVSEFDLYKNYSIGRFTMGCIRGCSFCVNKNKRKVEHHSNLDEFLDENRKYVCLIDDNILAHPMWRDYFDQLKNAGKPFTFKQGLDERLLTEEKCEVLFSSKYRGDIIFAFDNIKDKEVIEKKLRMIRSNTQKNIKFYVLCGYDHSGTKRPENDFYGSDIRDTFERIRVLMSYKCLPYIMRHKDYELSKYRGMYITLARWCNQPSFFKKKSFREFCIAHGIGSSCYRYMCEFESDFPDIAKKYYDMRWDTI